VERRAVEQDQRFLAGEAADQPVPHHPAAGSIVEHAVSRAGVAVEAVLLDVLEQGASGAVDDRLGLAGRAGGVKDVERVRERELREGERRRVGLFVVGVWHRIADGTDVRLGLDERHHDGAAQPGQGTRDLRNLIADVDPFAGVAVAVDGDEDLGLDLAEPVEHAVDAEIRRG
jgi:hypothetical protein